MKTGQMVNNLLTQLFGSGLYFVCMNIIDAMLTGTGWIGVGEKVVIFIKMKKAN